MKHCWWYRVFHWCSTVFYVTEVCHGLSSRQILGFICFHINALLISNSLTTKPGHIVVQLSWSVNIVLRSPGFESRTWEWGIVSRIHQYWSVIWLTNCLLVFCLHYFHTCIIHDEFLTIFRQFTFSICRIKLFDRHSCARSIPLIHMLLSRWVEFTAQKKFVMYNKFKLLLSSIEQPQTAAAFVIVVDVHYSVRWRLNVLRRTLFTRQDC